jgi:C4-dicarboxylate transporter DctM subunit
MAGVVPGILLGTLLMLAIYLVARIKKLPRQPRASWGERFSSFRDAIWGLLLVVIVMGGIYGGIFTPTEAAAVAAVYGAVAALFIYRDLKVTDVPKVLTDSARVSVMLMFIIANAFLFGHVLTTEQIPQSIASAITAANLQPWQFLIIVNIILLIAGNFMEPSAIILIVAPIIFPTAMKLGIDPIHLGIIFVVNMEIGMVTPPVGLNLFVASGITGMPLLKVVQASWRWRLLLLAFLILVTYVPEISLFLPNTIFGGAVP